MDERRWQRAAMVAVAAAMVALSTGCQRRDSIAPTASAPPTSRTAVPASQPAVSDASPPYRASPPLLKRLRPAADGRLPELQWDLRNSRDTGDVEWPKGGGDNSVYQVRGDFLFDLKLTEDQSFSGRVQQVEIRRDDDSLESMSLNIAPAGIDEVHDRVRAMLAGLGFNDREKGLLEIWYAQAKTGSPQKVEIKDLDETNREYIVSVVNDGTAPRPWSVELDIDWSLECPCHNR